MMHQDGLLSVEDDCPLCTQYVHKTGICGICPLAAVDISCFDAESIYRKYAYARNYYELKMFTGQMVEALKKAVDIEKKMLEGKK
jgi:hypothetical protein